MTRALAIALTALGLSGCGMVLTLGAHYQPGDPIFGRNPVGTARLELPIWTGGTGQACVNPSVSLEYEHLSSIRDRYDMNVTDQFGATWRIPLGPAR